MSTRRATIFCFVNDEKIATKTVVVREQWTKTGNMNNETVVDDFEYFTSSLVNSFAGLGSIL